MYFHGTFLFMRNIKFKLEKEDWGEGGSFSGFTSPGGVSNTVQQNRIPLLRKRPVAVLK